MLKILGISGSPRRNKNTETLLKEVLKGAEKEGAQGELYSVVGKNINPCIGCHRCQTKKRCVIDDDMQELYQKIKEADMIVIGTPVYFYDMTAQCKAVIDRTYAIQPINGNKIGGIVGVAGSMGVSDVVKNLNMFFSVQGITSAGWVTAYEPVEKRFRAKESARELGKKMVKMVKFQMDESEKAYAQLNHYTYGTHTN